MRFDLDAGESPYKYIISNINGGKKYDIFLEHSWILAMKNLADCRKALVSSKTSRTHANSQTSLKLLLAEDRWRGLVSGEWRKEFDHPHRWLIFLRSCLSIVWRRVLLFPSLWILIRKITADLNLARRRNPEMCKRMP